LLTKNPLVRTSKFPFER